MDDDFSPPQNFAFLAACFEGGLALLAAGLGWLLGMAPLDTLRWNLADAAWGAAATLPPLGLLWLCLKSPWQPVRELVRVVDEVLLPMFADCRLPELAVITILAGLGEEMLFRGIVQQGVADWLGEPLGVWAGLGVAGLLFAFLHRLTNTYALLAGLIGLYLGFIWLLAGNLLVPIIAHAFYDFLALIFLRRRQPKSPLPPGDGRGEGG